MSTADDWIARLELRPHPEGGYFRETYRSPLTLAAEHLPPRYGGPRPAATSILFLLRRGEPSALHRLASDELWSFHTGGAVRVHMLDSGGGYESFLLGTRVGARLQGVVPAGRWFGAEVESGEHALVGCAVAPGFDYADFELARRDELAARWPQHAELIARLTRASPILPGRNSR
jgi:predicted cupin superfamily sugar epimerase